MATEDPTQWHLSKSIPIGIVGALLAQTAAGVWWASEKSHAIENNTSAIIELKSDAKERDSSNTEVNNRLISLEKDVEHGNKLIQELVDEQRRRQRLPFSSPRR